ncbi:hypothetical protein V6N13_022967 [Hibiscus sabdariffa]
MMSKRTIIGEFETAAASEGCLTIMHNKHQTKDPESAKAAEQAPAEIPTEEAEAQKMFRAQSQAHAHKVYLEYKSQLLELTAEGYRVQSRKQVIGLRDKPVTQQELCRSLKICQDSCPGRTRCLCRGIPFVILPEQIIKALA